MEGSGRYYFTFISTGIVEDDKHLDIVKAELRESLPAQSGLIDSIAPMTELVIEENLDFEDVSNLIRVFRLCSAGFRVDLSSTDV